MTSIARTKANSQRGRIAYRLHKRMQRLLLWPWWLSRFAGFGKGSTIDLPVYLIGHEAIRLGTNVHIWHHARIEALRAGDGRVRIEIGDGSVIQPYAHIGAAERVVIGNGCGLGTGVYVTDHDHDFSDPDSPIVSNGRLIVRPTVIEDRVWLGERVMVLKGVTIGRCSVIGAGSVVTRSIPPYSIAVGSPARVVKTWDAERREWAVV